ncbi:putative WD repeat-containing protein alr3466 [Nostoc sp, PCC 7120] [Rhizoctonia solani]|uniref:Putative WD repeat-containing protein alr3466 [Nostoc sp, PCC 7120] n=1 Tax=Rhizoctonia solani TaxID=456999 RepID=A0A0K6G828_9AGAM|nr:putative WD repeat-containing protein alr3466 [Nostoc sp, PCC 7120] [Rhizoctonia solani]
MSTEPPSSPTNHEWFRHWITDVQVTPGSTQPGCKFSARVFANEELVCSLPANDGPGPPEWSGLLLCNVTPSSTLSVGLCIIVKDKRRYLNYPPFVISDVDEETGEATLALPKAAWIVTIKFLTPEMAEQQFSDEVKKLDAIEGLYNSHHPDATAKYLFKHALKFASLVAEAPTGSIAKTSFIVYMKTWELLDQQAHLNDTIQAILGGMTCIGEIVDIASQALSSLPEAISRSKESISGILVLLEDVSVYIFNQLAINASAPILVGEEGPNHVYDVEAYLARLKDLQEAFNASLSPAGAAPVDPTQENNQFHDTMPNGAQTDGAARTIDTYDILRLLRPMDPSGYDPHNACMDGTREALLTKIIKWTQTRESKEGLMWISGQAGMGKTLLATSLCQRLDAIQVLAGSFFCQRGDPDSSNPLWLINNLVHAMAMRLPAYAQEVANAIRSNHYLCNAHLDLRYDGLIKKPLERLRLLPTRMIHVIVIDALDECGDCDSREQLLDKLYELSQLVPWLKIIIAARPTSDIQAFIGGKYSGKSIIQLQGFDASADIRAYIESQVTDLAEKEHWPSESINELCNMSHGVFLWAALAIKYIKKSAFPALPRLQKVLKNQKSPVTDHLDALYTTALMKTIDDDDEITDAHLRCIGAILAVSERESLAAPDLQHILLASGRIDQSTFEQTIVNLSPLIAMSERCIRFCHPSFKSFVTDASRSGKFYVQLDKYEAELAGCCLQIMQRDLRFNICELETSHQLNSEVPDLKHRIDTHIRPALRYACTQWVDHFIASPDQGLVEAIKQFMEGPQLMYWIEALSLLGHINLAIAGLSQLIASELTKFDRWYLIVRWAKDLRRFLTSFYDPITTSTPHLYVSALAFAPRTSLTATRMRSYFPGTIAIAKGGHLHWHACIKILMHAQSVQTLSISPDGGKVLTGYPDGSLSIWDMKTGECVGKSPVSHRGVVTCVVFSPNGQLAASSSQDGTVRVWNVMDGAYESCVLFGHSDAVHCVAFSPDNSILASASSDRTIRLWDPNASRPIHGPYLGHSNRVTSVAFSPDGSKLVSGSWDKSIRVWSVDVGDSRLSDTPLVITGHSDSVTCVVFSPDGSKIASGSMDKTIQLWDTSSVESKRHISSAKHLDTVASIAFSPDGKCIVSCSLDGKIQLWDAATLVYSAPFGHCAPVNVIGFSPDGRHVVSGSTDMTTRVWEINTYPKPIPTIEPITTKTLVGHSAYVLSVAITPNGTRIVSGSSDKTVQIWDAQTGAPVGDPLTGHSSKVYSVAVSPDGGRLVSVSEDKSMKLWDIATRTNISSYQHSSPICCAVFSPDDTKIAFGSSDKKVYLWNVKGWQMIKDGLQGHSGNVIFLAFSPDGTYLASASADKTVVLWDVESHSRSGSPFSGHTDVVRSVAFSPCGTRMVSGSSDHTARVWDIQTGNTILTLTRHSSLVSAVAFSPDGSCIASGSWDDTLRLWNAKTGQPIGQQFNGHSNDVRSVVFSPDGNYLISGADDQTIRVWDISKRYPAVEPETQPSDAFRWPASPYDLTPHPNHPGWVTHDQQSLVFWLPAHYERFDMFLEPNQRNPCLPVCLNYSKFVHGNEWTKIACDSIQSSSK